MVPLFWSSKLTWEVSETESLIQAVVGYPLGTISMCLGTCEFNAYPNSESLCTSSISGQPFSMQGWASRGEEEASLLNRAGHLLHRSMPLSPPLRRAGSEPALLHVWDSSQSGWLGQSTGGCLFPQPVWSKPSPSVSNLCLLLTFADRSVPRQGLTGPYCRNNIVPSYFFWPAIHEGIFTQVFKRLSLWAGL